MKERKWEELELRDDFMFGKVMRNPEYCKEMLERLLEISIAKIEYPEEQKTIDLTADARSVRLDVYVNDKEGTVYNVEIQTTDTRELPKRSRYYGGMIDLNLIEKGQHYSELNRSYVIFICTFDLFGKGFHRYTFRNICREDTDIELGDDTTKIFFNTKGTAQDISKEAEAFLKYVDGVKSEDAFVEKLDAEVERVRKNEEWRREYMTLLMRDMENQKIGKEQGIEVGKEIGTKALVEAYKDFGIAKEETIKRVMQKMQISYETAEEYVKRYW